MTVTYSTSVKNARLQAVVDAIDAGSGAGTLEIGTSGMASVLATLTLADPCGAVAAGVLTLDFDPDITGIAAASGTAAEARVKDSDGNVIISGLTVGTSGTDIVLDSASITVGQSVTIQSGTIAHS